MTRTEILEEFKRLSPKERLEIIDDVIHLLREDIQQIEQPLSSGERKRQLEKAASILIKDYTEDKELIGFTDLDSENFHA
ncbi:MAG: hypothetical protein HYR55_15200 [Acidobacteria bacterium]|nr:hypothetical protein [Acidobacteriota bacterium]MBI3657124.1 hypothetical protein [Acidobacteriota bacterium]